MMKRPSFEGFRSPDGTRESRMAMYRECIREDGFNSTKSDLAMAIQEGEGPLGAAWDRIAQTLTLAIADPVIAQNQTAIEFLEIMRSIALTVDARETINMVLDPLKPMFQKQMAYDNKAVSQGKFDEAKFWMRDDLANNLDIKGKSKNQIAAAYVYKIKQKFGLTVSADTIARRWL